MPGAADRFCYVIYTAESDLTPHFLNGRKGVWVRTDEFSARFESRLANESEIRHLLDRRKLIRDGRASLLARARKRFATFVRRRYAELAAAGKTERNELGARLEVCVCPRFPARPLCGQGELAPLLRDNCVTWRQGGFPRLEGSIISHHESAIVLQGSESFSIVEANIWGMLFYGTEIVTETRSAAGIHLHGFIGSVLVFVRHAGKLLGALGYTGPVVVEAALESVLGVDWLHFPRGNFASPMPGSELDEDIEFAIATTSEALRENPDAVAADVLRAVFFSVNLPQLVETPDKLRSLILRGYDYNFWRKPPDA